ncbi:MAG: peptidase S10 [Chloroflexota bacterium]|jgi:carboxypeptidase C (cathepsin A)
MDQDENNQQELTQEPKDNLAVTKHTIVLNGETINYTATAGTMVMREEVEEDEKSAGEKAKATIFFIAYTRDDVEDKGGRPLTFSFNGGPGSSSVWLHLGLLGPRRVYLEEDGSAPPPPYHLVDNEFSLLDATDLVFIDPVSTGYSRAATGEKPKEFHNYKKDIESVGDFIRLYATRYGRWTSPKFLIGESYGTTRAAGLSGYLQEKQGMYLNGLMLISSILNFQTARFITGNDLPYILFLPSYTATAWYHGRLPEELQADLNQTLAEVKEFAMGEYTLALMKGAALPAGERATIVAKLARYTGLSERYIEQTNLRVNIYRFVKELLRDQRRTVGRLDSRFTGIDRDAVGENFEYDPSHAVTFGPYAATLNDYVRGELQFESDTPYKVLANLWQDWGYEEQQNQFLDVSETMRKAMSMNPSLKVFVANGYYDLATPFMATEYTFDHLELDPTLQDNVSLAYYEAGHMMYTHRPSLAKLKGEMSSFLRSAIPGQN